MLFLPLVWGRFSSRVFLEVIGDNSLGDKVDRFETLGSRSRYREHYYPKTLCRAQEAEYSLPGIEAAQLDHLSKLIKIVHGLLHLRQLKTDAVRLVDDFKDAEAHGGLEQEMS